MADDIDDLLDEVEESFTKSKLRCIDVNSESVKTDDLKDLLDEFEPPPQPLQTANSKDSHSLQSDGSKKCGKPCLSGTSVPNGMSTGVTLRACNKLRCLVCDLAVITFEGFTWTSNTDYLFLRNNYPDVGRLRSHLESQRGSRAYTCQCQHRSIRETKYIDTEKNLKWICGGH